MISLAEPLISTDQLVAIIKRPDVKLVDASWWLDGRDARADYFNERLPGAVFFDLDDISDHASSLPHMLPTAEDFAKNVGALGLSEKDQIVVYDSQGLFSAARVWWMFRLFGAERAVILDGGLPKWKAEGRPTETGPFEPPAPTLFSAISPQDSVALLADVKDALNSPTQILDARGAPRFNGSAPEPRAGVRSGHMPGALNLPYTQLLNPDKTMKGGPTLETAFQTVGLDMNRPVITSCGSGVTAAILTLGLAVLGKSSRLYDGSWSEWGSRNDTPVETET